MEAGHHRSFALAIAGIVAAMVLMFGAFPGSTAEAAGPGAAQSESIYSQNCLANGNVRVTFVWAPSGQGTQWLDVSVFNNNFASGWANAGPLPAGTYFYTWDLQQDTVYYSRVNTFTNVGFQPSDTIAFRTVACTSGVFSPPFNPVSTVFGDFVRLQWQRGTGNFFYCVDTALSQNELLGFFGSWRNWGCGTTGTSLDISNLACGRTYYWRTWAAGNGTSGYTPVASFTTASCNFSPPTNPHTTQLSNGIRFSWDRGNDNQFYCVDFALNQDDLEDIEGTWFNAGCGTTGTSIVLTGLGCGQTYYWRVWARGTSTAGYSSIATVETPDCNFNPPNNLESTVNSPTSVTFTWDEQDPALWFCVDLAESQSDLTGFTGTWSNHDCGGMNENSTVGDLECDTTYYWRVYAFAGNKTGYSDIATVTTSDCP